MAFHISSPRHSRCMCRTEEMLCHIADFELFKYSIHRWNFLAFGNAWIADKLVKFWTGACQVVDLQDELVL